MSAELTARGHAKLKIAEIFASIQGEGMWAGTPSLFIRVSGCNLRCIWCDTPYASWAPEGPIMEVDDIACEARRHDIRHVVLTGGEPMLFEPIVELAQRLRKDGRTITIETAGTVFRELPCDLMSISPKLANSTPIGRADDGWVKRHEETRNELEPLRRLVSAYEYQLKFVVNPQSHLNDQLDEIWGVLNAVNAEHRRVLLMAEGTDAETLNERERLLAPICLAEGFRLSPRLQIHWFGNTRGT